MVAVKKFGPVFEEVEINFLEMKSELVSFSLINGVLWLIDTEFSMQGKWGMSRIVEEHCSGQGMILSTAVKVHEDGSSRMQQRLPLDFPTPFVVQL